MSQISLREGLVVIARGQAATVIRCLPNSMVELSLNKQKQIIIVDIDEIEFLPSRDDENLVSSHAINFGDESSATLEELQVARFQYEIVRRYLAKEINLKQALEESGLSNGAFYKNIKLYDDLIGAVSLLRAKRGNKKGSSRLLGVVDEIIEKAINEVYRGKSASIAAVWKKVERVCIRLGLKVPSRTAVIARIKKVSEKELYLRKHGHEAASQKHGAKPGRKKVEMPLERVQMDHTKVDIILVDQITRRPIGRPWLTVLIDVKTRVILGYYLSLYPPSSLSVACAVAHAALPKNQFLRRLEVNGDLHPFFGVPRLLHMDNASEFKTVKFQRACVSHHIDLEWRPLGAKHYGGHIERLIGTLMTDYVHFLPGTTYSNTVNRRGYDSEKNSALSFKEFTRWFAGQVAIYHGRKHKGLGCSPASAWKKDFLNSSGEVMHPPIISDPWAFRLDFMPEVIRKVHPQGITLNKKWYWGPSLIPHVGIIRVVVKYDPHSMATVWAKLKGVYIQLHFSDVTESDFSFEERRAVLMLNRKEGVTPDGALDDCSLVDVIEDGEELVKRAVSATKRTRKMLAADFEHKTSSWAGGGVSIKAATGQATNLDKPDYSRQAAPYSRRT